MQVMLVSLDELRPWWLNVNVWIDVHLSEVELQYFHVFVPGRSLVSIYSIKRAQKQFYIHEEQSSQHCSIP